MSGPQAVQGRELERGLMLALDFAGMQAGGRKIEIVKQDDKNDAQVGVDIVKAFIDKDKVDLIVGPTHSHVALAIRSLVHDAKTILVNANAGAVQLAGALCSPYIVTVGRLNALYPEAMGRYLAKKGVKSVAVTAANYAAGVDIVQGFRESFVNEGGGKVVAEVMAPLVTMDFAPYLTQLADAKAEAAFAFYSAEQAINFIKQYDQIGLKAKLPLYTTGFTVEQDVLPAEGDSALGIFSTSVYSPFLDNEANKKFAPAYKNRHGAFPPEWALCSYDAGQLIVAALNAVSGNTDNKEALIGALMTTKIDSPRGAFKLGPNHTPVQDAYLREVVKVDNVLTNKIIATAWAGYYYPGDGCTLPGVKH
jgi:branched-chain amino acid transport system substrate-binding protein